MNVSLFLIVLFILQFLCFIVGSRLAKGVKDNDDYFLAGRSISFFPLTMTLIATQIGGGMILGSAQEAYQMGGYVFFYPLGACLGLLLLASGIGKRLARFNVSTVAQLFEVVYQSSWLKRIASFLSIISLFMILIAQVIASKKFMMSLGVNQDLIFLVFWFIVILYTVAGGLKAVIATDVIQALFFMIVFTVTIFYVVFSNTLSFAETFQQGFGDSGFELSKIPFSSWLLMPLLFMVIEQDMAQRCFSAKSGRAVTLAAACAALCILLMSIVPIYFGILGKQLGMDISSESSVFMTVVGQLTSPTITAFVACAVLAAILSTADSLLNAISSNLTQDFEIKLIQKKYKLLFSKGISLLVGCGAVAISFAFNDIVGLLIASYELSVSCLFVPVFLAMFNPRKESIPAILSVIMGAFGFIIFRYLAFPIPKELASLGLSGIGYLTGVLYLINKEFIKKREFTN